MPSDTVIKKGTSFKLSTLGNNGFYYPDENDVQKLDEDLLGSKLPWIRFDGLSAFLVESSLIKNRQFSTKNTVIWLED